MNTQQQIEMLRNPELRDESLFSHPSGKSDVDFDIRELEINAETTIVTTSSVGCADVIAWTIVFT